MTADSPSSYPSPPPPPPPQPPQPPPPPSSPTPEPDPPPQSSFRPPVRAAPAAPSAPFAASAPPRPAAAAVGGNRMLRVFRHPIFTTIWLAAAFSNIGNWMENVAQSWAVAQATRADPVHSAFMIELLNFADFLPVIFLALIAGVIADRVNRRKWLMVLQASACLLGASLAVLGFGGYLTAPLVIGITFLEGAVWALNGPAWMAAVPLLVPREEFEFAIAANSMQFNLARLAGPVLAGIVIGMFGVSWAFALNAVTFLPVLLALLLLPNNAPRGGNRSSVWAELREGVRFVWTHPGTRRLAIMAGLFMFFASPVQGLLAIFARDVLGGGSTLYGLMLGALGLGSVCGALLLGHLPSYYPRHHLIPASMLFFCGFALLYSFSTLWWLSLLVLFFCGVAWMLSLNPSATASQLLASDENRGRVMSVMLLCIQGAQPFGHLCAGGLVYFFSPANVIRLMLGAMLALAAYFLLRREPAIDGMERRGRGSLSMLEELREAFTAQSHWPSIPAEASGGTGSTGGTGKDAAAKPPDA